jgi:DNA-binding response OmpR family regulator
MAHAGTQVSAAPARTDQRRAPRVAVLPELPRILVVDDDECMRELVRLHLSNAGYEVEAAADAVIALRAIMRRPPALVIADVDMPYLNGLEFIGALRSDSLYAKIPVMFLTVRTDVDQRARELGALACLHKPLLAPQLLSAVAAALSNGKPAPG